MQTTEPHTDEELWATFINSRNTSSTTTPLHANLLLPPGIVDILHIASSNNRYQEAFADLCQEITNQLPEISKDELYSIRRLPIHVKNKAGQKFTRKHKIQLTFQQHNNNNPLLNRSLLEEDSLTISFHSNTYYLHFDISSNEQPSITIRGIPGITDPTWYTNVLTSTFTKHLNTDAVVAIAPDIIYSTQNQKVVGDGSYRVWFLPQAIPTLSSISRKICFHRPPTSPATAGVPDSITFTISKNSFWFCTRCQKKGHSIADCRKSSSSTSSAHTSSTTPSVPQPTQLGKRDRSVHSLYKEKLKRMRDTVTPVKQPNFPPDSRPKQPNEESFEDIERQFNQLNSEAPAFVPTNTS